METNVAAVTDNCDVRIRRGALARPHTTYAAFRARRTVLSGRLWLNRTASLGDDAGETPSGLRWPAQAAKVSRYCLRTFVQGAERALFVSSSISEGPHDIGEKSDLRFSRCNTPEKSDAQGPMLVGRNAVRRIFAPGLVRVHLCGKALTDVCT
ncbi:hypothetical protein PYCCODRAFT_27782 [Trametes coccinea BRFM310]|uniref:Uncharacterized protein n=1 Tax=Trametes coccinea (strain BRFM310) TaxID=1353009 RepID=A0A1Y2J5A4_TRAC3|nr:hypothetical protein PYCCODRAFT_27782 [Trametes coccinea BRFM310]